MKITKIVPKAEKILKKAEKPAPEEKITVPKNFTFPGAVIDEKAELQEKIKAAKVEFNKKPKKFERIRVITHEHEKSTRKIEKSGFKPKFTARCRNERGNLKFKFDRERFVGPRRPVS